MGKDENEQDVRPIVARVQLDPYLTIGALSKYSSLSRATIYRHIADPVHPLPVFRIQRRTLFRLSEFNRWMDEERGREQQRIDELVEKIRREMVEAARSRRAAAAAKSAPPPPEPPKRPHKGRQAGGVRRQVQAAPGETPPGGTDSGQGSTSVP